MENASKKRIPKLVRVWGLLLLEKYVVVCGTRYYRNEVEISEANRAPARV
tara:strand:+ start:9331 stop:9480 length:150 start_codon:yes stop_codon:yes gene_type:complete